MNQDKSQLETRIRKCVLGVLNAAQRKNADIASDTTLGTYLDSFSMVQLVSALEAEFQISFEYSDLQESNWINVSSIATLIQGKINS